MEVSAHVLVLLQRLLAFSLVARDRSIEKGPQHFRPAAPGLKN
jgi:hypothetical protein